MFLKSVTKSAFLKLQAFNKSGNEGICDGVCSQCWALTEYVFKKVLAIS